MWVGGWVKQRDFRAARHHRLGDGGRVIGSGRSKGQHMVHTCYTGQRNLHKPTSTQACDVTSSSVSSPAGGASQGPCQQPLRRAHSRAECRPAGDRRPEGPHQPAAAAAPAAPPAAAHRPCQCSRHSSRRRGAARDCYWPPWDQQCKPEGHRGYVGDGWWVCSWQRALAGVGRQHGRRQQQPGGHPFGTGVTRARGRRLGPRGGCSSCFEAVPIRRCCGQPQQGGWRSVRMRVRE